MSLCTMFVFDGVADPNLLHCTHKYFPDDSAVTEKELIHALQSYFSGSPFKAFQADFHQLHESFGKDGTYRVVVAEKKDIFFPQLKTLLDQLQPDSFPEYIPHVTVGRNTDALSCLVRDYILMKNGKQIWSAASNLRDLEMESRSRMQSVRKFSPRGCN